MSEIDFDKIHSTKLKFCIDCDCYLTKKNKSEWEVFIDNSMKTFPVCKSCYEKREKDLLGSKVRE